MKNKNYTIGKILLSIPIVVFAITVICMVLATVLDSPTDRCEICTVFVMIGILSIIFSPLPCLVVAVLGTVFASKARKEGIPQSNDFFVLGIVEIVVCSAFVVLAILMIIGGQSV